MVSTRTAESCRTGCELRTTTAAAGDGKYSAALSGFDLVPIETGGCSCLALVPAAVGAPRGAGQGDGQEQGMAQHLTAAAAFPCASVLPLFPHSAPAPRALPGLRVPLSRSLGLDVLQEPWQRPLWDKGLIPAVCCGTVLLVFLATRLCRDVSVPAPPA